jgi:hypothetical protein
VRQIPAIELLVVDIVAAFDFKTMFLNCNNVDLMFLINNVDLMSRIRLLFDAASGRFYGQNQMWYI